MQTRVGNELSFISLQPTGAGSAEKTAVEAVVAVVATPLLEDASSPRAHGEVSRHVFGSRRTIVPAPMSAFAFHPELFEHRSAVIADLAEQGFNWLSHYSSVDPMHEEYGIEVCGIHERADAVAIQARLEALFPSWNPG